MAAALLIIDMQQALCAGRYAAFDASGLIQRINVVSAKARSAGIPVVLIQHEEDDELLRFESAGWQIAEGLTTTATDLRVRKATPNSFHRTPLQEVLQSRGIDRVIVCGLQSDYCVDTTVRQALALGYEVTLISDGHSTVDNEVLSAAQIIAHHNATLKNMSSFGQRTALVRASDLTI